MCKLLNAMRENEGNERYVQTTSNDNSSSMLMHFVHCAVHKTALQTL